MAALLAAPLVAVQGPAAQAAPLVPPGFVNENLVDIPLPTDIEFTPDGRMLVTSLNGDLWVYQDGQPLPDLALSLGPNVCTKREQGLTGVTTDPQFSTNRIIYLFYTFNKFNNECHTFDEHVDDFPVNRVSRFVLPDSNVISSTSEVVILDNISSFGIHNAGDMDFGADGFLYVSVGDGGCRVSDINACQSLNDNARNNSHLYGKILRIRGDGSFPSSNPYAGDSGVRRCGDPAGVPGGSGRCGEIFATGLRNPFRFAFKPGTNTFHINDVGTNSWEEVNLGARGADYGFNAREGHCTNNSRTDCPPPPPELTDPIYDYNRDAGCSSITGAAFVPEGVWPSPYSGSYLFGDFICDKIFRLVPKAGGGYTQETLVEGVPSPGPISMVFGPYGGTQALYYATFGGGGQIHRLSMGSPAEQPPSASFVVSLRAGEAPLAVVFDAALSSDPNGEALTYRWDFGDGTPTVTDDDPDISHTYSAEGAYRPRLVVTDGHRNSSPVSMLIEVGDPPTATITGPASTARFSTGQRVTVTGTGADPDEGTLPGSALSWTVVRHHNNSHFHPFLGPVDGNQVSFIYPPPEDLPAAETSYLEVSLTVTDASGIERTTTQQLRPRTVSVIVKDNRHTPMDLRANDESIAGEETFTSWPGYVIRLSVATPQQHSDRTYYFASWSDGGAATHDVTTPNQDATYTANFTTDPAQAAPVPPPPPPPPGPPPPPRFVDIAPTTTGDGYWLAATDGSVDNAGNAQHHGDASTIDLNKPIVGMAPTADGKGYWLVATDGGIFSYGDAQFHGSMGRIPLNQPITGMAPTETGDGYWLVAADGGVFAFGDAQFQGSMASIPLNQPITGMAATKTGDGYWLVAADGGIFAFSDAPFHGSAADLNLTHPVTSMEPTSTHGGYTLVTGDGRILPFGDAEHHGNPPTRPNDDHITGIAATPTDDGYWLTTINGRVYPFGDAEAL